MANKLNITLIFKISARGRISQRADTIQDSSKKGFTIIEVLMSIAVIVILAGIGAPIFQSFQVRNDLDIASVSLVQTLRRAQLLSQAVDGDTTWGAYLQTGSITLFQGASYAARSTGFDEVFDFPSNITVSGLQEVVFSEFYGMPQSTGTFTLTSINNEVRNIAVNSKGMIDY